MKLLAFFPRSRAPAWECLSDASASRAATLERCKLHSHAGAWERVVSRVVSVFRGKLLFIFPIFN